MSYWSCGTADFCRRRTNPKRQPPRNPFAGLPANSAVTMGTQSFSSGSSTVASVPTTERAGASASPRRRMSTRSRLLFFLTAWLIVLMPFLFWWSTWFGRQLSDKQINEYLHDEKHPRHIQHALIQIGERIAKNEHGLDRWYPDLVRLSAYPV